MGALCFANIRNFQKNNLGNSENLLKTIFYTEIRKFFTIFAQNIVHGNLVHPHP